MKQRKGFAAMDPARVRQITAMGGRASHAAGNGYEWSSEQARAAALKRTPASRRAAAPAPRQAGRSGWPIHREAPGRIGDSLTTATPDTLLPGVVGSSDLRTDGRAGPQG
jgi:hypothetical protein